MPSQVVIRIKCDQYLIRFLESLYGESPISFPAKSNFNMMLDLFLEQRPLDYHEAPHYGKNTLKVRLPYFDTKNVDYYNYLSEKKQQVFVKEVWKFFKITFRSFVSQHIVLGLDKKDAIDLFIEKHKLPVDIWDSLEKDFQRYLKLRSKRKLSRKSKNMSV